MPDSANVHAMNPPATFPETICHFAWRFGRLSGRWLFKPFFELKICGAHHLSGKDAVLILPKHQRWLDIPLLGLAVPRPLYYVAKYELFRWPLIKQGLVALGGIPLNRRYPLQSRQSFKKVVALLRGNQAVVLFPEGTYYPFCMGPGRIGMLRHILARVTIPLVPVGIRYEQRKWRTRACIHIGKPVLSDSLGQAEGALNHMMQEIAKLSGR